MKYTLISGAAIGGLYNAVAVEGIVCGPKLQRSLYACTTADAYCSSLLGYTSSGTHPTFTVTTQTHVTRTLTKTEGSASITSYTTQNTTVPTVSVTSTISLSVATATVTSPSGLIGSPTCYVSVSTQLTPGVPVSAAPAIDAKPATSCGFKNQPLAPISTACSCYLDDRRTVTSTIYKSKTTTLTGVQTATVTNTVTPTARFSTTTTIAPTTSTVILRACPTPISTCNNTGLQWAYYTALSGNGYPSNALTFDPTGYKNATPIINGTTQLIDVPTTGGSGTGLFYGKGPYPEVSFFVNHRGYFVPPQTGNYTITLNYVDDAAFVYLGPIAYSGWNNSNYNLYGNWGSSSPTTRIVLTQGVYYPMRVVIGQGTGGGGLTLTITAPDGEVVQSSVSALVASPYFVAFGCNGTAPAFPPFGRET